MLMAGLGRPLEAAAQEGQVQWSGVERVVAFADVHGAHAELLRLLRELSHSVPVKSASLGSLRLFRRIGLSVKPSPLKICCVQ